MPAPGGLRVPQTSYPSCRLPSETLWSAAHNRRIDKHSTAATSSTRCLATSPQSVVSQPMLEQSFVGNSGTRQVRHVHRKAQQMCAAADSDGAGAPRVPPDGDRRSAAQQEGVSGPGDGPVDGRNSADGQDAPPHSSVSASGDYGQSSWAKMMLSLPLEVAAAASRSDSHYLQKRKRKHWWSQEHFPKVPPEDGLHMELPEPPISLWHKCLPLALVFFCASFNLTILQNLKDAIVVTAAGAEALPFLASFCVLPASLAFFFAYGRMVEALPHKAVFYASVAPLVAFYVFFASVLYPASAQLHPHGFYERAAPLVPIGLRGLLKVIETWTFSLFFCVAELWGSVVISVLFWTLANDVCTVADAKTIYPLMGIAANIALVVSGNYMKWVNRTLTGGSLQLSLHYLVGTVLVMSGVMFLAKLYIDRSVQPSEKPDKSKPRKAKKAKKKGSMADSLAVLRSSPKILNLALLVVSYGVSHRLFEFAWKGQLGVLYPSAQQYQGVLADVSIATGWATIALMVGGRFVFQYLGWGFAAASTPAVMLLTGGTFFGLSIAARLSPSAVHLAAAGVTAGAVTQVFARSSKFSLFDPAKEMVYIEMSKEEKSKGKAAVDLVGSQIGKSGASWLTQALLLATGSIQGALPIIAAVYAVVIAAWLRAVSTLGTTIQKEEEAAAAAAAAAAASVDAAADAEAEAEAAAAQAMAEAEAAAAVRRSESQAGSKERVEQPASRHSAVPRWPGDVTDALEQAGPSRYGRFAGAQHMQQGMAGNGSSYSNGTTSDSDTDSDAIEDESDYSRIGSRGADKVKDS